MPVHVMKLDVEGQELHALANASKFWKELQPKLLLIEIDPGRYRDCTLAEFVWFFVNNGWQVEFEEVFWKEHVYLGPQFAPTKSREDVVRWLRSVLKIGQYDMWAERI